MKHHPTILIADDHPVVSEALGVSLGRWFHVIGTVPNLERLEAALGVRAPDVLVLDLQFGPVSALSILPGVIERHPGTRVVILTMHLEPVLADAALKAGALGYVVKASAATELRVAIGEALHGRRYVTPRLQSRGAGCGELLREVDGGLLTERQREILGLLRLGLTYRDISNRLGIATKTVEYHVGSIRRRVGVSGRAQMIRWSEELYKDEPKKKP